MSLKTILVADTIHGNIQVSYIEKEIMSTQAFNRLHNISQNSSAYLTFPSNRTKRFEHSVGSMHLAGEIFFYSLVNSDQAIRNELLDRVSEEVQSLITDKEFSSLLRILLGDNDKLPDIKEKDPLYLLYVPKIIKDEHIFHYTLLFQSIRCAALLHDLGHPPFSHVTEDALKEIWDSILSVQSEKRTERQNAFIETMSHYLIEEKGARDPEFALHEMVGYRIADRLFEAIIRSTADDEYKFFLCIVQKFVSYLLQDSDNALFKNIHNLIAGSIDSDRLDYIVRDLNNSGFNHGRIEYDRLISSFKLIKFRDDLLFCSDIRALSTLEDLFNKRMRLYKYVIYHHRVVKTDNLLKNIIVKLASDYLNNDEPEVEGESDVLPLDISGLWKAIKLAYSNKEYFNALIQWDDAWLLTVLRQQYYDKYAKDEREGIRYQLEEFLSNKKHYVSIVKRSADFLEVDEEVRSNLKIDFDNLQQTLGERWAKLVVPLKYAADNYQTTEGFVLTSFLKLLEGLGDIKIFERDIEKAVSEVARNEYNVANVFVVFKKIKTGIEVMPNIRNEDGVLNTKDLSMMIPELHKDQKSFPTFFLYASIDDDINKHDFRKSIGRGIACFLNDWSEKILKESGAIE